MNPRDYADLAAQLANQETPSAADLRTAVSRAYYAAFNVVVALLESMKVKPPADWGGHKVVAEAMRHSDDRKLREVAWELDDLRKARWAADYDMEDDGVEH
jgi:uncharacterized protein (UPF0332 family)